jgi:DNA-directed RNA polymerase subunit RPC12/RpoP
MGLGLGNSDFNDGRPQSMSYKCPICGYEFDAAALRSPTGITGGSYCPNCEGRVRIFFPCARFVAVCSFLIALGVLRILHVHTILTYIVGSILIWPDAARR